MQSIYETSLSAQVNLMGGESSITNIQVIEFITVI
jgi:hypothetical protein